MKTTLPPNSGIPSELIHRQAFLFRENGQPSLTDVQWEALSCGVSRGKSLLVLAPTSTGKTQIGIWALTSWIFQATGRRRAVYLVTHRSLANQKFEEFKRILLDPLIVGEPDGLVLATGDRQIDANNASANEPLHASVLVATYEKYLGLLCGSGIPTDLSDICIVADEIQILGDKSRGVNIEILLALVRQARPGQIVGLSAVLNESDGHLLANWLDIKLVRVARREKHLKYECRTSSRCLSFHTDSNEHRIGNDSIQPGVATEIQPLIRECMNAENRKPIVVFCMRKQDVYDGCRTYCESTGISLTGMPLFEGLSADTPEAELLSSTMPHRVAIHCADLIEEDRLIVENALKNQEIDLVFATSTLAAGVNFPIGTVIFFSWRRWNSERRRREPIPTGEFHNMAGRCGRMGTDHTSGHVLFVANDQYYDQASVQEFLNPDHFDALSSRISPDHFTRLILQLAASNVVATEEEALTLLKSTYGAYREKRRNVAGLEHWDSPFEEAMDELRDWRFLR